MRSKILSRKIHWDRTGGYRSSWERIFAQYCTIASIQFDYEKIRVRTHKVWISDFLVDDELYEVGWHDHAESIAAFEAEGWTVYLIGWDELDLMRMFT